MYFKAIINYFYSKLPENRLKYEQKQQILKDLKICQQLLDHWKTYMEEHLISLT